MIRIGCRMSRIDEQDRLQDEQDKLQDDQDMLQDEQDMLQDEQDKLREEHIYFLCKISRRKNYRNRKKYRNEFVFYKIRGVIITSIPKSLFCPKIYCMQIFKKPCKPHF